MNKRPQIRLYAVIAYKSDDMSDFYGLCDDNWDGHSWRRHHVCVISSRSLKQYEKSCYGYTLSNKDVHQVDWNGAIRLFTKSYSHPSGYKVKVFRLFSKNCPYEIDYSLRLSNESNKKKCLVLNPFVRFKKDGDEPFNEKSYLNWCDGRFYGERYSGTLDIPFHHNSKTSNRIRRRKLRRELNKKNR